MKRILVLGFSDWFYVSRILVKYLNWWLRVGVGFGYEGKERLKGILGGGSRMS